MAAYQTFSVPYPRFRLTALPSPLDRAERLEAALRAQGCARVPRLYLKRDDLLSLAFGGNKIRNLEFLVAHALEQGATDVVTAGRLQSNHCRLTAAACACAGLRAHLVFTGARPAERTANTLLDDLLGARIYFTGRDDRQSRSAWIDMLMGALPDMGRQPYFIAVGGSDARGAIGHAMAAQELAWQIDALGDRLSTIVLASATGGTQAGMLAGLRRMGLAARIHGFAVAKSADDLASDITRLTEEVARLVESSPPSHADVVVDDAFLGRGYGIPSEDGQRAISFLARAEGILADPVYTGKALAGLLALIRSGTFSRDEAVVFVHTGGVPALFAGGDAYEIAGRETT